jgi:hypothetical protein
MIGSPSFSIGMTFVPSPCPSCISYKLGELTRPPGKRKRNRLSQGNVLGHCPFYDLTNLSSPSSMSLQLSQCIDSRYSSLAFSRSAALSAFLHSGFGT